MDFNFRFFIVKIIFIPVRSTTIVIVLHNLINGIFFLINYLSKGEKKIS